MGFRCPCGQPEYIDGESAYAYVDQHQKRHAAWYAKESAVFTPIPDPHPGRCQNYRNIIHSDGYPETLRCLDYELGEHVCRFPKPTHQPITDRNAIYSQDSTRSRPVEPWVAPWDEWHEWQEPLRDPQAEADADYEYRTGRP